MTCTTIIHRKELNVGERTDVPAGLFGVFFPMRMEPYIYTVTGRLAPEYRGGYWTMYTLSNGGFYMSPLTAKDFVVACDNGYEGRLSADALGITACLYAYSHLSFGGDTVFTELCAEQFHLLREYALDHPEAGAIMAAID